MARAAHAAAMRLTPPPVAAMPCQIDDLFLGGLHYTFMLLVFLWIAVYNVAYKTGYIKYEVSCAATHARLSRPVAHTVPLRTTGANWSGPNLVAGPHRGPPGDRLPVRPYQALCDGAVHV